MFLAEITEAQIPEWAIGGLATLAAILFLYGIYGFGSAFLNRSRDVDTQGLYWERGAAVRHERRRPTEAELANYRSLALDAIDENNHRVTTTNMLHIGENQNAGREILDGPCSECGRPLNRWVLRCSYLDRPTEPIGPQTRQ